FDETDFKETKFAENKIFTIAYTGVLTKSRVPYTFLKALNKIIFEDKIQNIKLVFAGKTCPEFDEEIEKNKLRNYYEQRGFLPHHESTNILQTADTLLLIIDDVPNNKGFLTGKIFEYLGTKKPIFAIGPTDGNANDILNETSSGKMVDYNDKESTYSLLKEMYNNWFNKSFNFTYKIEEYSRKGLTKKLAKIFDEHII
ncbi:MAG: hypothetical protein KDC52_12350, partial [Ignavibacteriae bacterium]|nr:hypothetical protein [Ignavibacteriota bacterium]